MSQFPIIALNDIPRIDTRSRGRPSRSKYAEIIRAAIDAGPGSVIEVPPHLFSTTVSTQSFAFLTTKGISAAIKSFFPGSNISSVRRVDRVFIVNTNKAVNA